MGLEMHTLSLCLHWCSLEKCASLRLWKESGWSAGRSSVDWCRYTHMVQQILNDDLVPGGGSFHQGSETRARLPVGQIKSNILKNDSSVTLPLRSIKTLTWRWHLRGYPAGTWPSADDPCPCSETGPSSLCSPSAPTQRLASGGKENRIGNQAAEPFLRQDCKTESGAVPEAGSTQCSHCHSWRPASRGSTLWLWRHWRSHQPPAGGLQCCRGRCTRRTSAGSNLRCSCRPDWPHAWDRTQVVEEVGGVAFLALVYGALHIKERRRRDTYFLMHSATTSYCPMEQAVCRSSGTSSSSGRTRESPSHTDRLAPSCSDSLASSLSSDISALFTDKV